MWKYFSLVLVMAGLFGCNATSTEVKSDYKSATEEPLVTGADRMMKYIPKLENKRVGLVVNQTSTVSNKHLVDSLLDFDVNIVRIFAPEHGFRGEADAGASIKDGVDKKTGLPIKSLYGKNKKPSKEDLSDIDVVVFDIQDVGCRFYTYISTLTYMMEACAQNNIPVIVLDRPNPNGHYVDGPVLQSAFSSFVGLHEIPVVYGMTIGEYAQMVNGEKWMKDEIHCDLTVVECLNYTHNWSEDLPVKPSPNLPNHTSILLYPSLCFFEGTVVSVGRGTDMPFQQVGHPDYSQHDYSFTPRSGPGSKYPKLENETCYGKNLAELNPRFLKSQNRLEISYLLDFYSDLQLKDAFFLENQFIDKLAGTDQLRKQILAGLSEDEIRFSWEEDIEAFKTIRSQYLLYE